MGNRYSMVGTKINENKKFEDFSSKYDFYLLENKVYSVDKNLTVNKKSSINESALNKMKHLMKYNPNSYVDAKKSSKF
jgi:hypothetical protein